MLNKAAYCAWKLEWALSNSPSPGKESMLNPPQLDCPVE